MNERQKQIYRLGQMYGYICQKHGNWSCPAHDQYATLFPMKGFTISLLAVIKSRAMKLDDEYISIRAASIDSDFPQDSPLSLEEQGTWTLGRMQIHRNVRSLINQTGLTQEQLAERLGVTRLTVGRWYRGEASPKTQAIFNIEEIILSNL
jgi:DNA-binding XRE family transcriptional regulator